MKKQQYFLTQTNFFFILTLHFEHELLQKYDLFLLRLKQTNFVLYFNGLTHSSGQINIYLWHMLQ